LTLKNTSDILLTLTEFGFCYGKTYIYELK